MSLGEPTSEPSGSPAIHPVEKAGAARNRKWLWIAAVTLFIGGALIGAYTLKVVLDANKWDPLGEYPIQVAFAPDEPSVPKSVVSNFDNTPSEDVTTIYWNQRIGSDAVKCVKDEFGTVKVRGILEWVRVEPPGEIIKVADGAAQRGPGCISQRFENFIPDEIRASMEKLKARGVESSVWRLTGTETPLREDTGAEGVPRTWITTTFRIIHEDAPDA